MGEPLVEDAVSDAELEKEWLEEEERKVRLKKGEFLHVQVYSTHTGVLVCVNGISVINGSVSKTLSEQKFIET